MLNLLRCAFIACTLTPMWACTASAEDGPERLFVQKLSSDKVTIKWRFADRQLERSSKACVSTSQFSKLWPLRMLSNCVVADVTADGHLEASFEGLAPDTRYYYEVAGLYAESYSFLTPTSQNGLPADGNTRILIVGDSGTQTSPKHDGEAQQVLDGYHAYNKINGDEAVDLFVALGDNAYVAGTDEQWQVAFFEVYNDILRSAMVVPTIGNHEMGQGSFPCEAFHMCGERPPGTLVFYGGGSSSADPNSYDGNGDAEADSGGLPYLNIFSLPAAAESGGIASGTEQYYSVDYNNVHIVSLDSQLSARDDAQRAAMKSWLESDLMANDRDWTIVIFHHPPYSKATNHDSDTVERRGLTDLPQKLMREEFTPVFEQHGVDLVYSGHSHSYERSYYLKGLQSTSDSMSDLKTYAELDEAGVPKVGRDSSFSQKSVTSGAVDDRVIYTVAGSSGKADRAPRGFDDPVTWLRHPAHVPQPADDLENGCDSEHGCHHGLALKGSVVVDADDKTLRARFVDVNGAVLDQVTIVR